MTERQGSVTVEGDFATLEFERRFPFAPEIIWSAITDPAQLTDWYMSKAVIEGRVGGRVDFWNRAAQPPVHITGSVIAWDPPRLFEHEWHVEARPEFPRGEMATIRWEILPEGDFSLLRLTHRHLTKATAKFFAPGVHTYLEMLDAHLSKRPLPDWLERLNALRPEYSK